MRFLVRLGVVTLAIVSLSSEGVHGQAYPALPPPLKGVTKAGVNIVISPRKPPHFPTKERLRTITELRLRSAGLTVLSWGELWGDEYPSPYVQVDLIITEIPVGRGEKLGGYAITTEVSMRVPTRYLRNGFLGNLVLWETAFLDVADFTDAAAVPEKTLNQALDQLLNEWLKDNPKP